MPKKGTSKYTNKYQIGYKFGFWTLLDTKAYMINKYAQYKVRCVCGSEKLVDCYTLINGKSRACESCGNSRKGSLNPSWKGVGNIPHSYFKREMKLMSKRLKYRLWKMFLKQNRKCALTGMNISFEDKTASLDRIDSNKGYVEGNLQWVHKDVNLMKNHFDVNYYKHICNLVSNNK